MSACIVVGFFLAGCGVGRLQTARPTPPGQMDFTIGQGFVYNELIPERDGAVGFGNFPFMVNTRFGVNERLDIGLRQFFLLGLASDVKVNLMPPTNPFALSVSGGLGIAHDLDRGPVINVPVMLLASYDTPVDITPYAGVGYSNYWITKPKPPGIRDVGLAAGESYAKRKGYGTGMLVVNAGVSIDLTEILALMLEYNFKHQVVSDPGDFFTFVDTHIVMAGLRFRWSIGKMVSDTKD